MSASRPAATPAPVDATPRIHPLTRYSGGHSWRLGLQHARADHMLIRLVRGNGHAVICATRHALTPQTTLFLPAGTLFSVLPGVQAIGTVLRLPQAAGITVPDAPQVLRTPNMQEQGALTRLIDTMQREQETPGPFHHDAAHTHATLIAIWLRRALLDQPARPAPGADARLAAAFADRVAQDHRATQPMTTHAEALGVSATHLSRSCKSASGLSASDILTEHSLHGARSLLADSAVPIGQIAAHLGFTSAAYFSRFMVKHTGSTPSELRLATRDQPQGKAG